MGGNVGGKWKEAGGRERGGERLRGTFEEVGGVYMGLRGIYGGERAGERWREVERKWEEVEGGTLGIVGAVSL